MISIDEFLVQLLKIVVEEKECAGFSFHEMSQIGPFSDNLQKDFVLNLEKSKFQVFGGIHFNVEVEENEEGIIFGQQDLNDLVFDKKTEEVILINPSGDFYFFLAPNFSVFLEILLILVEYESLGLKGEKYTLELKQTYFGKIREVLENEKFIHYYARGLGLSLDV